MTGEQEFFGKRKKKKWNKRHTRENRGKDTTTVENLKRKNEAIVNFVFFSLVHFVALLNDQFK